MNNVIQKLEELQIDEQVAQVAQVAQVQTKKTKRKINQMTYTSYAKRHNISLHSLIQLITKYAN